MQFATGAIVPFVKMLLEDTTLSDKLEVSVKRIPLRLWYMCGEQVCSVIDVDEILILICTKNF